MFVCEDCLRKDDKLKNFLQSHGRCEVCGKVKVCWDIDIHSKSESKTPSITDTEKHKRMREMSERGDI